MLFVHSQYCCQQYCLPLSRLIAGLFSLHHHIVQRGSQPVTMMPNHTVAFCFQQKSVTTNMFQPVCSIWRSIRCVAGIMYRMNPVHSKFKKSLNLVVFWSNSLFSQSFSSNIQFKENSLTHSIQRVLFRCQSTEMILFSFARFSLRLLLYKRRAHSTRSCVTNPSTFNLEV